MDHSQVSGGDSGISLPIPKTNMYGHTDTFAQEKVAILAEVE
jgi:hypothetical protein